MHSTSRSEEASPAIAVALGLPDEINLYRKELCSGKSAGLSTYKSDTKLKLIYFTLGKSF